MTKLMGNADLARNPNRTFQSSAGVHKAAFDSGGSANKGPGVIEPTVPRIPEYSSPVPESAQASAADGKHAHAARGKSDRTIRRQKKALRDLQAQGFQTLPDFFRKKAEERDKMDKFEAMVARVKAKLKALQSAREEEELEARSESESESEDEDEVVWIAKPASAGSTTHQNEQEHATSSVSEPRTDTRQKSSWPIFEEDKDFDGHQALYTRIESGNDPVTEKPGNLEDAQDVVSQMLKDLCHRNNPEDSGHQHSVDNAWDTLRDRVALRAAQEELAGLAKEKKLGDFVHSRILAMEAVLNIFLDEDLGFTWTKASTVVAKTQGRGTTRARSIREWVMKFVRTRDLPLHHLSWKRATVLGDEEITEEIRFVLAEKAKKGHLDATSLIDVVSSPEMQARFVRSGIDRPSISLRTAHRWLAKLGWQYGKQRNGMYIDGHEREDVVEYRRKFVDRFQQYERRFHIWDDDGNELPRPSGFPVPETHRASGRFRLILVTHDESVFFQNDQRKYLWDQAGKNAAPRPKGEGQSLMVSDFLTADWGRLRDDDRCVPLHFSFISFLIFLK